MSHHRTCRSTILPIPAVAPISPLPCRRLLVSPCPDHARSQAGRYYLWRRVAGHFASKSRRYSTTLGALRRERRTYRQRQAAEQVRELLDEDTTLVIPHWEFAGIGYLTTGDAMLALFAAARARAQRQAARDAA
ncbi:MAG: hypothetical protein M3460_29730 [Actinomycetota bacterium]|nr:hypothetical protein [Actinomycetota bacterium]